MIMRAMQRSNHGGVNNHTNETLKFNHLITVWPPSTSSLPSISYNANNGVFSIPNASLSDYLITWSISIITSTVTDGFGETFQVRIVYSGEVTQGCFSCCTTGTGLMKGHKTIHISSTTGNDVLQVSLFNNGFSNDMNLTTPSYPLPSGFTENNIYNMNICIMSI